MLQIISLPERFTRIQFILPNGKYFYLKKDISFSQPILEIILPPDSKIPHDILSQDIKSLPIRKGKMKARVNNCLASASLRTIQDLMDKKDELYKYRTVGEKSIKVIQRALKVWGYSVSFRISPTTVLI